MKKIFYLLIGLVMLPALLYAQGNLSLKQIYDDLHTNYSTSATIAADYATTASVALKADKTYVDATDEVLTAAIALKANQTDMDSAEAAINSLNIDNDSQDVQIEANRVAITLKASQTDMDSAENAIQLILADDDSQDVAIEANKVGVASVEVGLQTHKNKATGAHTASAINTLKWSDVQTCLDSLETAIQSIVVGSGFALESWVNSTLETNFYNKTQTNATIEAAIAAIPAPTVNLTISVTAGETLAAGDVVSLINTADVITAEKTDNTNVAGICQGAYDTTEAATILIKGTDTNQSGLITGALYYRQADYSIGTTPVLINGNYIFVGYGASSTNLILD